MVTHEAGLINILEIAMNSCCQQHNLCRNCLHINSCIELWDRASETVDKDITIRELKGFIEEFNDLWASGKDIQKPLKN